MPSNLTPDLVALAAQCASEPVHTPGAIQANGGLIYLDEKLRHVLQVSANIEQVLGVTVAQALSRNGAQLLGDKCIKKLLQHHDSQEQTLFSLTINRIINDKRCRFNVNGYPQANGYVVEIEAIYCREEQRLLPSVNHWLGRLAQAETQAQLLQLLTEAVRTIAGYDRVMVYRFDADWHGCVSAESRTPQADPYLGHSFPATDIPAQVRALYLVNPIRSIPDVQAPAVTIISSRPEHVVLDMSLGMLRAVSPQHVSYMQNMGVQAALSMAIKGKHGLWGLLACHGLAAKPLSPLIRDAIYNLVQMGTQRLFLLKAQAETAYLQRVHDCRDLLVKDQLKFYDPLTLLEQQSHAWLSLFSACGVALVYNQQAFSKGGVPNNYVLLAIASWLNGNHHHSGAWVSQQLASHPLAVDLKLDAHTDLADCCGLLAVPLALPMCGERGWLLLFRPERLINYQWAGRLEAESSMAHGKRILSPKRSFEIWQQQIQDQSETWLAREQRAAIDIGENITMSILVKSISDLNGNLTHANRQLEHIATTDALTRVWNRYRIEQALNEGIQHAADSVQPLSLLLLDVDFFKRINDQHGHEAGDRVLINLAQVITRSLRDSDCLGRWGGEEFIVMAQHCHLEHGKSLAERIRQAVLSADFGDVGPVTLSIGVSSWRCGDTRSSLVERADQAMYAAKQAGRNCVRAEHCEDKLAIKIS
ncbi:diguanylate cyclase domain-containing protein [Oceanisphaera sp. W20_SRM_FM3]|uniref:sensor domain-containing diguanylate cyclase n=1 Tax=Oceanisphaera sp. W20_SRM_FM3 TaxID=3240267 RepID=UPI003F9C1011